MSYRAIGLVSSQRQTSFYFDRAGLELSACYDGETLLHALNRPLSVLFIDSSNPPTEDLPGLIALCKQRQPKLHIVLLDSGLTDEQILSCLIHGAQGVIKPTELALNGEKLIRALIAGEAWISRRLTAQVLRHLRQQETCAST